MEGTAQTILSNVGQLVGKEIRKLRAVGSEIEELRDELATMHTLLRMHTETEDEAVDHFIREWMRQVRELTYDAEDCVDIYIFHIRCRPGDRFLVWSKRLLATLFPRHRLAAKITALRARAVSISERHARYGVGREALRKLAPVMAAAASSSSARGGLRPANHTDQIVGLQNQATFLADKVKAAGQGHDVNLKVFSIVGFGGLGKTTLAMEVCRQLEADFDRQAQVSVSQMFDGGRDLKELLKRVLQQIVKKKGGNEKGIHEEDTLAGIDTLDADILACKLKDLLKDMRFLIVIDDVWTLAAWDAIRSKIPDNKCGSRIIVTTRIETVAKECCNPSVDDYYIYRIQPLNPEYSRKLFLSRTFGTMAAPPDEQLEVMDNILKKCGGLPLAIVSIASLLACYKYPERKDMWETICKSIGSQMESNRTLEGMGQILILSYNHLPYHLKACMLYLSLFPEDYEINKNRLLYRWIAEGLVEEKRGLTLLEVAESYFDELISRSMIIPASSIGFFGKMEACRVHDMMLEVMVSKSLEANFVSFVGGQYEGMSYNRVRRLSVQGIKHELEDSSLKRRSSMERMGMQHVRSLSMFDLKGQKLFDRLRELTLLRVLDLEGCQGLENKHVVDICQMYLLKFLSLKGTDISVMPNKVGELEHLQVLDVRDTNLRGLPETVRKLEKAERVDLSHVDNVAKWQICWTLPKGISKMKALREVDRAKIDNIDVAREFGELGQLRRIYLFVDDHGNEEIVRELALSLSKLYSLRSLSICRFGSNRRKMDFLERLPSPPRLLRFLFIDGYITKLPDWVISLSYLTFFGGIWLHLRGDQIFSVLCKLPNLQSIKLWRDCYLDRTLVVRSTQKFPVLRALSLCSIYCSFPEVIQFEKGCMDKLEELWVTFCEDKRRSIVGIEHLPNLKEVQLMGKRNNSSLTLALEELKTESNRRPKANQFKVIVRYE